jgi:hypothetical protein
MNNALNESGSRKYYKALTALLWLALPADALLYATWWNRLPARLATHFNFENQPNGWMSREASLMFSLVFATVVIATATWFLWRVRNPDPTAWALLVLFYVVLGTLLWAEDSVIAYNASGRPVNVTPVLVTGIVSAILVTVVALVSRRGSVLPPTHLLAEETHSSAIFGLVLFAPAVAMAVFAYNIPLLGVRVALGLGALIMFAAAVMAWEGFHYLFSPSGVEIRTLGFRLRSIPANQIESYAVDRWKTLGGYGIRGVGERRAYVWGNTGVWIRTSDGEVFLGHNEPGRIIHDLDVLTKPSRHEGTQHSEI